jgi:hypothetical protein
MSQDISSLLNGLYANDQVISMEKTAEDSLLAALQGGGQAAHNPYASMSNEDLISLLDGQEKVASDQLLEKTAAEMLGGQVMAHAMVHEMGLIKVAMLNGLCRVCKESPMDTEGSSICSGCLSTAE